MKQDEERSIVAEIFRSAFREDFAVSESPEGDYHPAADLEFLERLDNDLLSETERAEFSRHVESCPFCRHEIAYFIRTGALFAEPETAPNQSSKPVSVVSTAAGRGRFLSRDIRRIVAAAALVLVAVGVGILFTSNRENPRLARQRTAPAVLNPPKTSSRPSARTDDDDRTNAAASTHQDDEIIVKSLTNDTTPMVADDDTAETEPEMPDRDQKSSGLGALPHVGRIAGTLGPKSERTAPLEGVGAYIPGAGGQVLSYANHGINIATGRESVADGVLGIVGSSVGGISDSVLSHIRSGNGTVRHLGEIVSADGLVSEEEAGRQWHFRDDQENEESVEAKGWKLSYVDGEAKFALVLMDGTEREYPIEKLNHEDDLELLCRSILNRLGEEFLLDDTADSQNLALMFQSLKSRLDGIVDNENKEEVRTELKAFFGFLNDKLCAVSRAIDSDLNETENEVDTEEDENTAGFTEVDETEDNSAAPENSSEENTDETAESGRTDDQDENTDTEIDNEAVPPENGEKGASS